MSKLHSYDEEKVFFYQIDTHAKSIPSERFVDIESVVKYLRKPVPREHEYRELFLARAIIVWLGQRLEEILSGIYRFTPVTIVKYVERIDLAHVFKLLCGEAGVECVVIDGHSKDSRYRPGDVDCCTGEWNAFMAGGEWHLVHPVWCTMCLEGQANQDEIQIEVDGRVVIARDDESDQRTVLNFNEFWFCTNPLIFYLHCYPIDVAWQLQPEACRTKDVEEFCGLPYLHSLFFENKLRLVSECSCLMTSKDGKCKVVFQSEKNSAKYIDFSYTLSLLNTDDEADSLELDDIPLLVFYARNHETVSFEIRFPLVGVYMFRLFIDDLESEVLGFCCEFSMLCTEVDPTCKRLPIDAGFIGWGFGHQAEEAGIREPSESNPKLVLKTNAEESSPTRKRKKIRFDLDTDLIDEMEYDAAVYVDPKDVAVFVPGTAEANVDKDKGELEIKVSLQHEGEYALVVKAKRRDDDETKAVLNFLLQTSESEDEKVDDVFLKQRMRELHSIEKRAEKIEQKRKLEDMVLVMHEELLALKQTLKEEGHYIPDDEIENDIVELSETLKVMDDDLFDIKSEFEVELTYTRDKQGEINNNHRTLPKFAESGLTGSVNPLVSRDDAKKTSVCALF